MSGCLLLKKKSGLKRGLGVNDMPELCGTRVTFAESGELVLGK